MCHHIILLEILHRVAIQTAEFRLTVFPVFCYLYKKPYIFANLRSLNKGPPEKRIRLMYKQQIDLRELTAKRNVIDFGIITSIIEVSIPHRIVQRYRRPQNEVILNNEPQINHSPMIKLMFCCSSDD